MLQKFFRNKNISNKLKLRLMNTVKDKTLTYASETRILTKRDKGKGKVTPLQARCGPEGG